MASSSTSTSNLFTPLKIGNVTLQHRIALAPLTRYRASKKEHVPLDFVPTYYSQRSSMPGTFLISEATLIAPQAGGQDSAPGIWTKEQITGWRKVTSAVHENKSHIFLQLWALGRAANNESIEEDGYDYVAPSPIPLTGRDLLNREFQGTPRELTYSEIQEYIQLYAQAAQNAIEAGFDGVEVHGANGYLPDQFIQNVTNERTDQYGGSVENRSRFLLEVMDAVVSRIGAQRSAVRLSPYSTYQNMRMEKSDLKETFSYLISELVRRHGDVAYLHMIDGQLEDEHHVDSLGFVRQIWGDRKMLVAGGFTPEMAFKHAKEHPNEVIVFGKSFTSNPDLPYRIQQHLPLAPYQYKTFYAVEDPKGYIDWPTASAVTVSA